MSRIKHSVKYAKYILPVFLCVLPVVHGFAYEIPVTLSGMIYREDGTPFANQKVVYRLGQKLNVRMPRVSNPILGTGMTEHYRSPFHYIPGICFKHSTLDVPRSNPLGIPDLKSPAPGSYMQTDHQGRYSVTVKFLPDQRIFVVNGVPGPKCSEFSKYMKLKNINFLDYVPDNFSSTERYVLERGTAAKISNKIKQNYMQKNTNGIPGGGFSPVQKQ